MNGLIVPPQKNPLLEASGLARREWFLYWQAIPGAIAGLVRTGTWAQLQATVAGDVKDGTLFLVTDRGAMYQSRSANRLSNWILITGELRGLYADRPADFGANDAGFRFTASDQTVTYRFDGSTWKYESGTMRDDLVNIPGTLGTDDEGFSFWAQDFRHLYRWDGTAWDYADEDRAGRLIHWDNDPGSGWQVCDGSTGITTSKADGTTDTIDVPDLTDVYLRGGAYTGAVNPASGTLGLTGVTGDEDAHTHEVTTAGSVTSAPSATVAVQSGAGTNVPTAAHTHTESGQTVTSAAGSAHHHDLTGAVVDLTGDPIANMAAPVYRRL